MRVCVFCKTRYQKGSGVTFHKFPTADCRLELWLKHMKLFNWRPKKNDYLCSKHFSGDCFIKHESRTTLKNCSIPTIFSGSTNTALPSVTAEVGSYIFQPDQDKQINLEKMHAVFSGSTVTTQTGISLYDCQQDKMNKVNLEKIPHFRTERATSIVSTSSTHERKVTPTPSLSGTIKRRRMEQKNTNLSCWSISNDPKQSGTSKKARSMSEVGDNIKHDHRYVKTSMSCKKKLQRVQKSLRNSRARVKVLSQHVKRLKLRVSCLRSVISELKKK